MIENYDLNVIFFIVSGIIMFGTQLLFNEEFKKNKHKEAKAKFYAIFCLISTTFYVFIAILVIASLIEKGITHTVAIFACSLFLTTQFLMGFIPLLMAFSSKQQVNNKVILNQIEESLNEKFKLSYENSRYIISIQEGSTLAELFFFLTCKIEGFAPLSVEIFERELPLDSCLHLFKLTSGVITVVTDANEKQFYFELDISSYKSGISNEVDVTNLFVNYNYLQTYFS